MSKVSFLLSRTKTNKQTGLETAAQRPLQAGIVLLLTLLGAGVGLDLQNHRGYGIGVHVIERVGDPLRREQMGTNFTSVG